MRVRGRSMWPFLLDGSALWVERCETAELAPGDLIVFRVGPAVAIHRVAAVRAGVIRTRGDALPEDDGPLEPARFLASVQGVALGRAQWRGAPRGLARFVGRLVLSVAPGLVRLRRRVSALRARLRRRARPSAAAA